MRNIRVKTLMDESRQPIAVQIEYGDWLEIKKELGVERPSRQMVDLNEFAGTIELAEDPLEYQRRVRDEWDERSH